MNNKLSNRNTSNAPADRRVFFLPGRVLAALASLALWGGLAQIAAQPGFAAGWRDTLGQDHLQPLAQTSVLAPIQAGLGHEVVFIDAAVEDVGTLVREWHGRDIVVLPAGSDPWRQMAAALGRRGLVSAVHVVSHGAPGQLRLGGSDYAAATLPAAALQAWRSHLTANADIFVYGCEVAAGRGGAALMSRMADLTGADVMASTDKTGAAGQDANWRLEARVGGLDFQALRADSWTGVLASFDASFQVLDFSYNTAATPPDSTLVAGTAVGAKRLYRNVITIGGQQIDAIVTFAAMSDNNGPPVASTLTDFDSTTNQYNTAAAALYIQPNFNWSNATPNPLGGSATYTVNFIEGGSYSAGNPTGTPAELRNVAINSYDLDQSGTGPGRQYTDFTGIGSYELSATYTVGATTYATKLEAQNLGGGVTRFIPIVSPNTRFC